MHNPVTFHLPVLDVTSSPLQAGSRSSRRRAQKDPRTEAARDEINEGTKSNTKGRKSGGHTYISWQPIRRMTFHFMKPMATVQMCEEAVGAAGPAAQKVMSCLGECVSVCVRAAALQSTLVSPDVKEGRSMCCASLSPPAGSVEMVLPIHNCRIMLKPTTKKKQPICAEHVGEVSYEVKEQTLWSTQATFLFGIHLSSFWF